MIHLDELSVASFIIFSDLARLLLKNNFCFSAPFLNNYNSCCNVLLGSRKDWERQICFWKTYNYSTFWWTPFVLALSVNVHAVSTLWRIHKNDLTVFTVPFKVERRRVLKKLLPSHFSWVPIKPMPSIHATRMFVVLIYYYFFRLPCGRKKGTRTGEGEYAKRREGISSVGAPSSTSRLSSRGHFHTC